MALILPNTIANGLPADGDKLNQNLDTIEDWANQEAITRDGSTAMTQPLLLAGPPTQPDQAATKGYVDNVAGGTYMGGTSFTSGAWGSNTPAGIGSFTVTLKANRRYLLTGVGQAGLVTGGENTCNLRVVVGAVVLSDFGVTLAINRYAPIPIWGIHTTSTAGNVTFDVQVQVSVNATGEMQILRGSVGCFDAGPVA